MVRKPAIKYQTTGKFFENEIKTKKRKKWLKQARKLRKF